MLAVTVNDEKEDGTKAIWTIKIDSDIAGPTLIAILARICSENGFKMNLEQLKFK